MKGKPNTDQFKTAKDPSAFLESGAADAADKSMAKTVLRESLPPQRTEPLMFKMQKEQKLFRLSMDIIDALKRESYERSVATRTRVTEVELVEQALRAYLKLD